VESRDPILGATMQELLDALAARTSAPAGGSAAALAVALGAAMALMAARFAAGHWEGAGAAEQEAGELRAAVEPLAQADADAYGAVLSARRLPPGPARERDVDAALASAVDVPLRIAGLGLGVARLAQRLAEHGNPNLRGDAAAGAVLAEAGSRIAASLVRINVGQAADGRVRDAERAAQAAAESAHHALRAASP
jgi:formiminotetrahydrofolate cyclodeaminase